MSPTLSWLDRVVLDCTDPGINAISGATAGIISALVVCPLDVAKTKLQAQGGFIALQRRLLSSQLSPGEPLPGSVVKRKYHGFFGTLSTIFREEGIKGLYRGVVPITIGYLPTWAIYFVVYEEVKNKTSESRHLDHFPFMSHMISALTAGAISTLATNPIWVVKTRLMTQTAKYTTYHGTLDAFRKMYRNEGIMSFYAGLGPALLGLLHVAVQFPLYEYLKTLLKIDETQSKMTQIPQILTASVLAKVFASSITYPHEVIRTRTQIQLPHLSSTLVAALNSNPSTPATTNTRKYRGIIQTAKTVYLEEGWRAFYSGLGTNMVRTVPASAVTLLSFEISTSFLKQKQHKLRTFS